MNTPPKGFLRPIKTNEENELNVNDHYHVIKNLDWQEADQLVVYKRDRGIDWTTPAGGLGHTAVKRGARAQFPQNFRLTKS